MPGGCIELVENKTAEERQGGHRLTRRGVADDYSGGGEVNAESM